MESWKWFPHTSTCIIPSQNVHNLIVFLTYFSGILKPSKGKKPSIFHFFIQTPQYGKGILLDAFFRTINRAVLSAAGWKRLLLESDRNRPEEIVITDFIRMALVRGLVCLGVILPVP